MKNITEIQNAIYFVNDGETDLLTGSMSPNLFNQFVRRDAELADRNGTKLAIISVKIKINELVPSEILDNQINTITSDVESLLIKLSFQLSKAIRQSDCLARTSKLGFWILVTYENINNLEVLISRILEKTSIPTVINFIPRSGNQTQLSWYENIDNSHFN
ncbi:MAG: hypothetical protein F2589_02590 [Actinobacteria bacterium]|jgi:GGDEF domain-containing protein|uniref:Unannotated protein n=1 Tax=freshwater metagenome TaxID=449393 RepID=A0A6J6H9B2_9ZZZZ|nr:hypothetical protein [Actinomycetota bacterium]